MIGQYTQGGTQGSHNSAQNDRKMVETRNHPESCLQHPFDLANNFLSRFPVDFKGCFNCGQTDHWQTKSCPEAKNGNFNKIMLFNEMWDQ